MLSTLPNKNTPLKNVPINTIFSIELDYLSLDLVKNDTKFNH